MSDKARRIIITGANGFIGSRLVRRLRSDGDSVIAFVRDVDRSRGRFPDGVEIVRWSHTDESGAWRQHVDGAHAIVNLAGASVGQRWTDEHKRRIRDSRVLGTRHLVAAIEQASVRPEVLVNASAVGYYGACPTGRVTESSPPGDDFLADVCKEWEAEAVRARDLGLRVALVRSGVVLDRSEGPLPRMILPFKLFVGGPIGAGTQPLPWIHIDDEVEVFRWALNDSTVEGPLNAVAPDVRTNADFSRELGRALHRPSFMPAPSIALRAMLGDGAIIVTEGQWAYPERTEALGFRFRHPELGQALRSLVN